MLLCLFYCRNPKERQPAGFKDRMVFSGLLCSPAETQSLESAHGHSPVSIAERAQGYILSSYDLLICNDFCSIFTRHSFPAPSLPRLLSPISPTRFSIPSMHLIKRAAFLKSLYCLNNAANLLRSPVTSVFY